MILDHVQRHNPHGWPQQLAAVLRLLQQSDRDATIVADTAAVDRMVRSHDDFVERAHQVDVYGMNRGFGPLAEFAADPDPHAHARGLINHLTVGSGPPLAPSVSRTVVNLRLRSLMLGQSGIDVATWKRLADQWNAGFTPVMPSDGSLSASGDLVPLAHAAQSVSGAGEAWFRSEGRWTREPAAACLRRLGLQPVRWEPRAALAFVNGASASLGLALHNHERILLLTRASALLTGRLAALLGCDASPFSKSLAVVRGHPGHHAAALWITGELQRANRSGGATRPLQEPYSLRCAPQVLGAVLDQLKLQGGVLVTEASGCTDNPVLVDGRILHGGNFHGAPIGHASESQVICVNQLAYLLERQLALIVDPARNGGEGHFLAHRPGHSSGLAGAQIAATAQLGAIRQHSYPASCTPVPTNLGNQDHVPLSLNSANAVRDMLDRAWRIAGTQFVAVSILADRLGMRITDPLWSSIDDNVEPMSGDRALADEIGVVARVAEEYLRDDVRISATNEREG